MIRNTCGTEPDFCAAASRLAYACAASMVLAMSLASPALAQRDLKDIPSPDPEEERKSFIVADGFEVNLFAGDPMLHKPIQMNFDAQGRLWIASSEVYPQIKPGQKATDKILVLEDTDGDGQADKTTVFADGLLIPTGVIPGDGGCYVANSTELIHLKDTDGDGKADQRRVVLSGFGTEDTHHLLHTLRWGVDGCLYMNQSIYIHSHVETPWGVKRLNGGGIWRFRPETLQLEVLCYGFVNPWGHHQDRWGQSFATDGAYGEGINYVFPGSVFVAAPGAARRVEGLNPGSPKHCGLEIVGGGHLPPEWDGNMITNDFRAHRVCRFVVTEDGSGYASKQAPELIKTTHVAFRPIDVKMGPDGAIYIADWYNPIIQHGEVDFRDERRDHTHGRIWRVTAKGRKTLKTAIPENESVAGLLERLKSENEWVRQWAKLMLKNHGAAAVAEPLKKWVASLDPSDPQTEHHRLEALWTYECIDTPEPVLLDELIRSKDHRVRAAAIRTAVHWLDRIDNAPAYFRAGVADEHPRVRLEAVRALALVPQPQSAAIAATVLDQPMDRFLDFALWQTMRDLAPVWVPAVKDGSLDFGGRVEHLTFALKAVDSPAVVEPLLDLIKQDKIPADRVDSVLTLVATLGGPKELGTVWEMIVGGPAPLPPDRQAALLKALVDTSELRKIQPAGDLSQVSKLLESPSNDVRAAAARAAGVWKIAKLRPDLEKLASSGDAAPEGVRFAAISALASLGGPEGKASLLKIAQRRQPLADSERAISALVALDPPLAAKLTAELLAAAPQGIDPQATVGALVAQKQGSAALAAALANAKLSADTAKLALRVARAAPQPSEELIAAIQQAGGLGDAVWKLTPELMNELVAEVREKGNAARGEAIYRRADMQCMKCHAIGGSGGQVGPDFVSIGASAQIDYLIESLIAPAAKVKENYHSQLVLTDAGDVITGIVARETEKELVLRDQNDKLITIAKDSIEERKDGRSLMPDGLMDPLTREELVDLTRFLSELGKVGDYSIGQSRYVRRWEVLTWSPEAHQKLNRTSYDTAATNDPALSWESAYSRVRGDLPLEGLPTFVVHQGNDPTTFVRFQIDVTAAGKVKLLTGGGDGLTLWVDGKPAAIAGETIVDLPIGLHTLTLAVNRKARTEPLRVELVDVDGSPAKAQLVGGK